MFYSFKVSEKSFNQQKNYDIVINNFGESFLWHTACCVSKKVELPTTDNSTSIVYYMRSKFE